MNERRHPVAWVAGRSGFFHVDSRRRVWQLKQTDRNWLLICNELQGGERQWEVKFPIEASVLVAENNRPEAQQ